MRVPSDRKILQTIYDRYHDSLENFDRDMADRETKIMVPIDCEAIAKTLQVHSDIVFGRLYYHLEQKYGYARDADDPHKRVAFFALQAGKDRHCVNLPFLAAVLAGMQEEGDRYRRTAIIAAVSVAVSLVSLLVASLTYNRNTQPPAPPATLATPTTVPTRP